VRVAANLHGQARRLAVVVLSELESVARGGFDQMFTAPLQQARIGWMGNCFGHDRRVDDHALYARCLDHACTFGGLNRRRQQLFDARFTEAFAPACQARRIDWWLRLQECLAREDLPIGVLDPLPHDVLIRQVKCVLQIKQARDQAR
jgi:hypothetical protein